MHSNGLDSIREISKRLRTKTVSPVELTQACLVRVERRNPALNAFITVTAERALEQARRAEKEILNGQQRGPLHGVPIGLKDLIDTAGIPTTSASALHKHRVPTQDAIVVQKLTDAGVVLLGKQNLHEFAYGGSSLISYFGAVRNAWNRERIAGGSSGGSAAAVAAGLGWGAIGTDTAGSIREPAALCGVVGLKPTYGRVSAQGVFPLSQSLDHVGPITRTVAAAAMFLPAITGAAGGATTPAAEDFSATWNQSLPKLRVGVPRAYFFAELEADIAEA